jgi:hypothetical protein
MAAALGQFIQEEHTSVGQRDLARQRHVAAPDQHSVREGVVGGAARAGGDQGGAVAGLTGDAVDAHGAEGFSPPPHVRLTRCQA